MIGGGDVQVSSLDTFPRLRVSPAERTALTALRDSWVRQVTAWSSWERLEAHLRRGFMPTLRRDLYACGSLERDAMAALRLDVALWLVIELGQPFNQVARNMTPELDEHERALVDARVKVELAAGAKLDRGYEGSRCGPQCAGCARGIGGVHRSSTIAGRERSKAVHR